MIKKKAHTRSRSFLERGKSFATLEHVYQALLTARLAAPGVFAAICLTVPQMAIESRDFNYKFLTMQ